MLLFSPSSFSKILIILGEPADQNTIYQTGSIKQNSGYKQSTKQDSSYSNNNNNDDYRSSNNQNSLLKGEYDERESANSFQEALKEWRMGGDTKSTAHNQNNNSERLSGMFPFSNSNHTRRVMERSNSSVSGKKSIIIKVMLLFKKPPSWE